MPDVYDITVVVPTHNRSASLIRLFDALCLQTFPAIKTEVVVVANGITDDTISSVQHYTSPYTITLLETGAIGPAAARNAGAAIAKGSVLLFLDDDIEPGDSLLAAHVESHQNRDVVTIGYLPLRGNGSRQFFGLRLRNWWDQRFANMQEPGYRFGYDDLLSGNFSIRKTTFQTIGGFDPAFHCREDYELGARLMMADVEFNFAAAAWGYHHDERNNFKLSVARKAQEGAADVKFMQKHPSLGSTLPLYKLFTSAKPVKKLLLMLAFDYPRVAQAISMLFKMVMPLAEYFKWRKLYKSLEYFVLTGSYLSGASRAGSDRTTISRLCAESLPAKGISDPILIDLSVGISRVKLLLDESRPSEITWMYQTFKIGDSLLIPGKERWKGKHLTNHLLQNYQLSLLKVITLTGVRVQESFWKKSGGHAGLISTNSDLQI